MVGVRINGLSEMADEHFEIAQQLAEVDSSIEEPIEDAVEKTANEILDDAKSIIRDKGLVDEGNLLESGSVEPGSSRFERVIEFDDEAAASIENGSRPHVIEASSADSLAFDVTERLIGQVPDGSGIVVNEVDKTILVDRVAHPGTSATPFLKPALDRNGDNLIRNIDRAVQKTFDEAL